MRKRLAANACVHALVDFSCALLIFGRLGGETGPLERSLLYNFFAFAMQMPVGILADWLGRCRYFSVGGCLLAAAAWFLPPNLGAAVAAGLGNACFHVGGGLDTLNGSGSRAGPLGIFVAPGALGVYLGTAWAGASEAWRLPAVLLLAASAVILARCGEAETAPPELASGRGVWAAAVCFLAVVILRSWMGLAADFPWKAQLGLAAVCAVAGGKAAGGLLADRLGMRPVVIGSLTLAAVCFAGSRTAIAGLAALLFFNMTMPLTLWAVADQMPGMKGFSFGLLTFGLFLGALPVMSGGPALDTAWLAAGSAASLALMALGLRWGRGKRKCGNS